MTHHRASGREVGLSDEQIDALPNDDEELFDEVELDVIRFAVQLSRDTEVEDELAERLKDSLSETAFVELGVTVGVANMTNRVTHAFEIPLES